MRLSRLIVPAVAVAVCACTSSPGPGTASSPGSATAPAATQSPPRPGAWDWPNYHRDPAHTGFAGQAPPAGPLSIAWTRRLDGAVYGQPLAIGGLVVAATEDDSIYGAVWVADVDADHLYQLDPATGRVRQRIALGSPLPHFASPSLSGPFALIGTMSGVTAVAGA